MKRIILFCLIAVGFSFAEYCRLEESSRVDFLDTTIWYMGDRTYFFPSVFTSTKATHTIGEVFRDEFLHWQQCEKLSLTYEEADSLIAPLVEEMERDHNEFCGLECDPIYDTSKFYYSWGITLSPYPKTIMTWIEESCETEFVGRDVVVPKDLQGEKYIIFDMNGKVLESGLAGVRIKRHAYPVILKIKGRIHYLR